MGLCGNLAQPLERVISDVFIPSLIGCNCSEAERDLIALPVHMGGLGLINPSDSKQYRGTTQLAHATWKEKDDGRKEEHEEVKPCCQIRHRELWTCPVKKVHPTGLQLFLSKTWVLISTSRNFVML